MKIETIHIKPKQTRLPNSLHLEVQQRTRMNVFRPKKGKGSYNRQKIRKVSSDDL